MTNIHFINITEPAFMEFASYVLTQCTEDLLSTGLMWIRPNSILGKSSLTNAQAN